MKPKKFIFIILLMLICNAVEAQHTLSMVNGIVSDTLKAGKRSFIIKPDYSYDFNFTISAKTVSGIDTLTVQTVDRDTSHYSARALIDLSTGAPVNQLIATTTRKEYLIYDPLTLKMKIASAHALVQTLFTVSRK